MEQVKSNEELARIFAMYMPCKAIFNGLDCYVYIIGVNWGEHEVIYTDLTEDGEVDYDALPSNDTISGFQLILKPLSGISDEDMRELAKIIDPWMADFDIELNRCQYAISASVKDRYVKIMKVDGSVFAQSNDSLINPAANFLRSKSYDIDGLLESGIAITKPDEHGK